MTTLARMQYHQRQAFQADSDDEEDAVMNAPGPSNPDARYAADDGLDGLDAEEAEQERLLSERFGEAGEAPSEKRKTAAAATDQDIAAELAGEVRRAKKSRPTLQPADLAGPANGLNRIKNEFNDQAKYRGVDRARLKARGQRLTRDQLRRAELNAAAAYSRDLVGAYRNYCRDLFPALAFEDTVSRIENLSSKKEVKDYVEIMREDVRRQHLVKIYGAEKTDRMLAELESNLVGGADGFGNTGADGQAGAVANPYGSAATNNVPLVEEEEEEEEEVPPPSPTRDYRGVTRFSQRANPYATTVDASSEPTPADKDVEEEEEEEVEASFDEEDVAPTGDDIAAKEAGSGAELEPSVPDAIPEAGEVDEQDQNNDKARENEEDDEEEELEFVDAPKEKEDAEEEVAAAKSSQQDNEDGDIEEDADDEQLFFDGTQPSQATDASPAELLGQETPSPQSTPEGGTPPSSEEKGGEAPAREVQEVEEPDTELPETEAFGMPSAMAMEMMEEDVPTQHVAHDDGEEVGSQELVMDATQETLTNVLPTMTAPDAEDGGDPMSQMSLEY